MSGDPAGGRGPAAIEISPEILEEVCAHAREAYPAECCGWLSGPAGRPVVDRLRPAGNAQAEGDHPTAAERSDETAYVIAGDDLLAFVRAVDDRDQPARVIYHSHPNGRAYFSATDRQVALSPFGDGPAYPVQQLVVGLTAETIVEAALFGWSDEAGDFVELRRWDLR